MNSLTLALIDLVVHTPWISIEELMEKLDLTKVQVDYQLRLANELLGNHQFSKIIKKNGRLFLQIDAKAYRAFVQTQVQSVYLNPFERQKFVFLLICLYENQTMASLAKRLNVSKNTIQADLKEVATACEKEDIHLVSAGKKGYSLKGCESSIRRMYLSIVQGEKTSEQTIELFLRMMDFEEDFYTMLENKVEALEQKLGFSFSEQKLFFLVQVLCLSILRNKQGAYLEEDYENYAKLLDIQVTQQIKEAFENLFSSQVTSELNYLTMHALSLNMVKKLSFAKNTQLEQAIKQAIDVFEQKSITHLDEKEKLYEALYQHLIPASLRIKLGIPDKNALLGKIKDEHSEYFYLVKQVIEPIELVLDCQFEEDELAYLVIIFISFLRSKQEEKQQKKTAIVVCRYGVSISRLLLEMLKELFPNIHFVTFVSYREFKTLEVRPDIIFSTVHLETDIPTFFIKHFLTDKDKIELKRQVEMSAYGKVSLIEKEKQDYEELLAIIEKYTNIKDKENLIGALKNYLSENQQEVQMIEKNTRKSLSELLPQEHIQISNQKLDLEGAIRLAAKPLLANGYIEERYIQTIMKNYHPDYPYFVIAPDVALPHASNKDGVNKLGMSFLRLKDGVEFSKEFTVRMIFIIAPVDQHSHIDAITKLYKLVSKESFRNKLLNASYERELQQIFMEEDENE